MLATVVVDQRRPGGQPGEHPVEGHRLGQTAPTQPQRLVERHDQSQSTGRQPDVHTGRTTGIPVAHRQGDEPVQRWPEGTRAVIPHLARLGARGDSYFLAVSLSLESAAMKASWGTSTRPTIFIRFLPSFCFSSSLRLRVMSPP